MAQKRFGALIHQAANRNDREPLVELHRRQRIASMRPDESFLEVRMRDRLGRRREARAELRARRAHLQIRQDRVAPAQTAGDEHRDLAQMRQDFLRQNCE